MYFSPALVVLYNQAIVRRTMLIRDVLQEEQHTRIYRRLYTSVYRRYIYRSMFRLAAKHDFIDAKPIETKGDRLDDVLVL
jgi:hypothetical protein